MTERIVTTVIIAALAAIVGYQFGAARLQATLTACNATREVTNVPGLIITPTQYGYVASRVIQPEQRAPGMAPRRGR